MKRQLLKVGRVYSAAGLSKAMMLSELLPKQSRKVP